MLVQNVKICYCLIRVSLEVLVSTYDILNFFADNFVLIISNIQTDKTIINIEILFWLKCVTCLYFVFFFSFNLLNCYIFILFHISKLIVLFIFFSSMKHLIKNYTSVGRFQIRIFIYIDVL